MIPHAFPDDFLANVVRKFLPPELRVRPPYFKEARGGLTPLRKEDPPGNEEVFHSLVLFCRHPLLMVWTKRDELSDEFHGGERFVFLFRALLLFLVVGR